MILFTSFHHFLGHKNERNCSSPGSGQHHRHTAQVREQKIIRQVTNNQQKIAENYKLH